MANGKGKSKKRYRGSVTFEGKKYYVSGYSKEEVQIKREEKKRELEEGTILLKRMTVRQWTEEWIKRYKEGKVNDRWLKDLRNNIEKYILDRIGPLQLSRIRQIQIQEIMDQLEGKSQSLINKTYDQMYSIFSKALINGFIQKNPVYDIVLPKSAKEKKRRSISEEERELIIKTAKDFKGGLFFLIMLHAGLRNQEVAGLKWKNVDFEKDEIHVREMLKSDGLIKTYGKSDASHREVFISKELKEELQKEWKKRRPRPDDYVVTQRNSNKHQTRNSYIKLWNDFKKQMHLNLGGETTKVLKSYKKQDNGRNYYRSINTISDCLVAEDLTSYCLRHTFCTDLKAAGVPIDVAKDVMGHSSITITSNIYSHAEERSFKDAKKKIDKLNQEKNGK